MRKGQLRGDLPVTAILHVKMCRNYPGTPSGVPYGISPLKMSFGDVNSSLGAGRHWFGGTKIERGWGVLTPGVARGEKWGATRTYLRTGGPKADPPSWPDNPGPPGSGIVGRHSGPEDSRCQEGWQIRDENDGGGGPVGKDQRGSKLQAVLTACPIAPVYATPPTSPLAPCDFLRASRHPLRK
jgi:hypothetical protein